MTEAEKLQAWEDHKVALCKALGIQSPAVLKEAWLLRHPKAKGDDRRLNENRQRWKITRRSQRHVYLSWIGSTSKHSRLRIPVASFVESMLMSPRPLA
jgi:hypothetical protein